MQRQLASHHYPLKSYPVSKLWIPIILSSTWCPQNGLQSHLVNPHKISLRHARVNILISQLEKPRFRHTKDLLSDWASQLQSEIEGLCSHFPFCSSLPSLRYFHVKVFHRTSFLSCKSRALLGQKSLYLVIGPLSNQRQNFWKVT